MLVPKYVLTHEAKSLLPFCIWEQAEIDGKIAQKRVSAHASLNEGLTELGILNGDKPIILAYSTKLMDNSFDA